MDTIAKNGTMLLNILQKPDGTVDVETMWLLKELEKWFAVNGEAVYGTRPWRVSGEGTSYVKIEGFTEEQVIRCLRLMLMHLKLFYNRL